MTTPKIDIPTHCPQCGDNRIAYKAKVSLWECLNCEDRFAGSAPEEKTRRLDEIALHPKAIFFSYGHDDNRELVRLFKCDLEKRGHQVWFDEKDIGTWDDWKGQITRGIDASQLAIAFMSRHSIRAPRGVCLNEIAIAMNRFGVVYPVILEAALMDDVPVTIRHLQFEDLSQWKSIRDGHFPGIDWDRWYEEKLLNLIAKLEKDATVFADETRVLRETLQPASFESKIAQHVPGFVGREWITDAYTQWLDHQPQSRLFWIKAGPGVGKSAIAANLAHHQRSAIVASWFCDAKSSEFKDPNRAIKSIAFQLALRWEDYRVNLLRKLELYASATNSSCNEVRKALAKKNTHDLFLFLLAEPMAGLIWRDHKLVVIIDGLDEATEDTGNNRITELISNELNSLPDWIGFVVTSRPEAEVVNRLGGFKPFEIDAQDLRNLGDLRAWYQLHLARRPELIALSPAEQSRVEELLIERSGGMILYLKMVDEGFREGSITVSKLDGLEFGLPGLYRRYYDSFQTRFGSEYEHAIKPLLRLLLSAGGSLPKDLACEVLHWNSEQFLASRNRLGSYVLETSTGFELFHKTLGEWLGDQSSGPFHLDIGLGRQLLADVLFKEVAVGESHLVRWRKQIQDWLPIWLPDLAQREDALSITNLSAKYLDWADYINARLLLEAALDISEKVLGPAHPDLASSINNLAVLLSNTGDYAKAEPLYRRALEIREKALGPLHSHTANSLNNLASLLKATGDYAGAEPLYRRALEIDEKVLGPVHPTTANSLNNLASLLKATGDYAGAEPLNRRALEIREKVLGPAHPATAGSLNNLASLLKATGDYAGAEPLYRRALEIDEKVLGPVHPTTAISLNSLASLLEATGDYAGAEPLYRRALEINEKVLGPVHPATAMSLNNLASLLGAIGDTVGAEPLFRRAVEINETVLGPAHLATATSLNNLASLLETTGDTAGAESLFRRALEIHEKVLGLAHPATATCLNNLASLLEAIGDTVGAEPLFRRALEIREKVLGPAHPDTATSLNNLASLLETTGDTAGAEPLFRRALEINEKVLGPVHPTTASSLANLAWLLKTTGDYAGAKPLFRRALEIREKALGPAHPDTARIANILASLLKTTGDYAEAEPLFRRALETIDSNELANRYKAAVEEKLGLSGKIDGDGDVIFKHPDLGSFYFSIDAERDPEYMMLVFPNFTNKELTGGDKGKLLELVNQINSKTKAVKLVVRDDTDANVSANMECFLAAQGEMPTQDLLNIVIARILSAIRSAVESLAVAARGGGDAKAGNSEEENSST